MISNFSGKIQKYLTPYKYPRPVLVGSGVEGAFDSHAVDIPFVFFHNNLFYMMYTGFNGRGYQTALSVSTDLLNWRHRGVILKAESGVGWDKVGAAGTWIIKDSDNLFDIPRLKKIGGRYWLAYHSYPSEGYEEGPAEIGLAWTEDESLLNWNRMQKPVLSWRDGRAWERGGLYKACIICKDNLYYMLYNAKDEAGEWKEQTGMAASRDLLHWERCGSNPVIKVSEGRWDERFVSDPYVVCDEGQWLNFYFGYDNKNAQEGLALSEDLVNWEKVENPILTHGSGEEFDGVHAHKAAVLFNDGILYHFYCSVRKSREGDKTSVWNEFRTISVAASRPW